MKQDTMLTKAMRGSPNLHRAFGKKKKEQASLARRIAPSGAHSGNMGPIKQHVSSDVPSGFNKSSFYSGEKKRHVTPRRKR